MKNALAIIILSLIPTFLFAQHCPFDGANLIVVKLTDKKGKAIKNAKFTLREIENENAESCSFAKGLLNKPFEPSKSVLNNIYKMDNMIERYCADCSFLGAGFYAVKLNMSEETCMIKDGNNYKNQRRKFEINVDNKTFAVTQKDIHPLCTNASKWSRIKAIGIKVP